MKISFITFFLFFINLLSVSQQVIDEKIKTLPDGKKIKLITTPRNSRLPDQDTLTTAHEKHKIVLQDSINRSEFEVMYYLEEYQSGNLKTEGLALHPSSRSYYVNELIIYRMANNRISISMRIPGFTQNIYVPSIFYKLPGDGKISHSKWKIFTETPFEKNVPLLLIYIENPDKDTLEKKVDKLFQSPSFKTLKDKDKIINQIKSVTNHFYMVFYDVTLKK